MFFLQKKNLFALAAAVLVLKHANTFQPIAAAFNKPFMKRMVIEKKWA